MNRNIVSLEQPESNVLVVTILDDGTPRKILLTSDHHCDNAKSQHWLIKQDLKAAVKNDADIYMFGDTLDAMDGAKDRRSVKGQSRPENMGANYFDLVVNNALKLYAPYRKHILAISNGNHETSIVRHNEVDLILNLVNKLRGLSSPVHNLPYWGWLVYRFVNKIGKPTRDEVKIYFHHGHGGGGEVTKGMIQMQRKAAIVEDADVIVMGHVHEAVYAEWWKSVLIDYKNKIKPVIMIRTSTYKQEYVDNGFHVITGRPPKPLGSWWLDIIPFGKRNYLRSYRTFVPWWELEVGNQKLTYDDEMMKTLIKEYQNPDGRDS